MKPKVLVTRYVYPDAITLLSEHAEIEYNDSSTGMSADHLSQAVSGKQAVVCQLTDTIDAHILDSGPQLRVIANVAVGYDNIDVGAATERGILVTNTPGILTDTTADFAFALMMAAARRIAEADRFVRDGRWKQWKIDLFSGHDIHHHRLGIFGMGRIGQGLARRARGFEMQVVYHDVTRLAEDRERELGVEYVTRETLFQTSDFISVHVPLNERTRHCVGTAEFALMKPHAVFVNTSRGPVVDEMALVEALASKRIAAAGLDVFENEPALSPGLLALDNVVLAPHIASASIKTRTRMCTMAVENAVAVLNGQRPPNAVNPEANPLL